MGNIQYDISANSRWKQIQGVVLFNYCEAVGFANKATLNKQKFYFRISFTVNNYIPATGTIQVVFPSSVTTIHPDCRSDVSNGSQLFSASGSSG